MTRQSHASTYPRFLLRVVQTTLDGPWQFYVWMTLLTAVALVGFNAWAHQLASGMAITGMSDHVSWGLYIANFTFGVGLAAGAVMMVIPAYLYDDHDMHDVVLVGEILAIGAISICLGFIVVDLGRPDRFWHLIPGIGRFNWPISMLTWDVIVLNGYLLLNLHITGYLLYMRFLGKRPSKRWYVPFVFLSIGWAISIHTITAFLYAGLGGRPFWNSALLAPRFIASAFVTGPAFVLGLLYVLERVAKLRVGPGAKSTLSSVLRVTVFVNLFMFASEAFTAFYTGGAHASAAKYLFFGDHGKHALVPWIWSALALNVASAVLVHLPASRKDPRVMLAGCAAAFAGVWIEKGMGLIVPGFVPSTLHEIVEYVPTLTEWKITVGIWAMGFGVLTLGLKVALPVLRGELSGKNVEEAGSAPQRGERPSEASEEAA
jgi:Ni/Fe-hydrogenase subunit HybB-like protein